MVDVEPVVPTIVIGGGCEMSRYWRACCTASIDLATQRRWKAQDVHATVML